MQFPACMYVCMYERKKYMQEETRVVIIPIWESGKPKENLPLQSGAGITESESETLRFSWTCSKFTSGQHLYLHPLRLRLRVFI